MAGSEVRVQQVFKWHTQNVVDGIAPESRLSDLYEELIDIARDQINSQLAHADMLDLKSIGALGTIVAVVVACFAIRSVSLVPSFDWWWKPLFTFVPSLLALVLPLRGGGFKGRRNFVDGPRVPDFLEDLRKRGERGEVVTFESSLIILMQLLETSRRQNDKLLEDEARQIRWGVWLFGLASITVLVLYAHKLT
jgi:hypothetical protein